MAMRNRVRRTSKVSIAARKTNGAHLSIMSKSCPPTSVKMMVPSIPANANTPIMLPLIWLGMPFMSKTSTEIASTTVKMIKRTHIDLAAHELGSFSQINEYPVIPRSVKDIGTIIVDGTLSPSYPSSGSSTIVATVAIRMICWYKSLDSPSLILPSSTKLVIHSSKKFENRTAMSRITAAPMKQIMYLASLPHSWQTRFRIRRSLANPFGSSDSTYYSTLSRSFLSISSYGALIEF